MAAAVSRQGPAGVSGGLPGILKDLDPRKMSSLGRLAYLFLTGRLTRGLLNTPDIYPDNDTVAGGQAQPSIAVDSTGQHIVIGANYAGGFGLNPISVSGFKYSDDGGRSFTDGGPLPITTPITLLGQTAYPGVFGDPEVKYLGGSTFIYFSIIVVNAGLGGPAQTLGFHRSTDFGHTWTGPFEIPPATNPNGLLAGLSVDRADKPFADVDPDTGRVMVSWSNFTPFALGGVEISTTFSDNIMDANPVWSNRSIVAAADIDGQSSIPRFAGNGSRNVYVAWQRFPGANTHNVGFARSTDNGATWSNPRNAASPDFFMPDQVLGDDRVNSAPGLAVDNSSGPGRGNIYLVYSNNNLRDGADIVFQRSTDGGLSFSNPIFINSRPGSDRAQWYPWVTVDNSSGRVYVFYYDQGIATNGDLTQTTYQFSDDNGLTWSQPMPLTDRPFKAGWGNDTGQPNLGDYNQAVAQNGELFAAWAQTELLPFTSGLPSTHMETPGVVFRRVPASSTKVTLTSNFIGTTFTDGNGNGFIDAGEQVRFKFPLTNYVTNPTLNPGVITGIVATLSTTTPTVTVVQGTSGYPSIAPGATATNDTDFIVQLSPAYVRGTPLDLVLNVSSNQGLTVLRFTHSTGTPRADTIFQENFDSTAPGTLPAGWLIQHKGGNNTVPWTTSSTFNPGNNGAFHVDAADGLAGNANRWERLLSPLITVPANSEYATLDFDVMYNTQDDPDFNILAYDGFLLAIGDYGPSTSPPSLVRSVLAEAFEEEFTTGNSNHYPKHFPRSNSTAYLQDLSAWAGDSGGVKHVHARLNGMAGRSIRLFWEYTQDDQYTCNYVRPGAPACGVLFDNLVVQSVVTIQADLSVTTSITSGPAISGQNITYTIGAVNNGPTVDVSPTVTDDLPSLLSFVSCSATGGGACSGSNNHQTVTLPPGDSNPRTITLVAAVSCSAAGGTPLSNTATINSPIPDPDSSNNFSMASTTIVNPLPVMSCPADIVTTAQPGQTSAVANYTITATDNCPLPQGAIVATPASGSPFLVGTTRVTATATDSGGDRSSCSFNVTVNAPTTTDVRSVTGQYGGPVTLTATVSPTPLAGQAATGTVNFFVNGNLVGSSSVNASGVAVFPYTIVQVPGTYPISANYLSTSPFFLNSAGSGQLTVVKATASVAPNASGKIYGSADPVLTGTLVGFLASDNVTAIFSRSPGQNVGTYTISAALSPASVLGNYTIAFNTAAFVIAPLAATVTPTAATKTFGDDDPALTGTLAGFLAADNVTASYSRTAGETPGTYAINTVLSPVNVLANYAITTNAANVTINKYSFSVCNSNGQCTGGSKPNSNGVGGRLMITPPATPGGNATATVTLSPAAVNGKNALTSPGRDANNQPLPPVFKVWLAPVSDPTHPVLFGTGVAAKTGPDANGNYAWSTSITATLAGLPITPGNYTASVFGDDGGSLTNNQVPDDAGYGLADTADFMYPTLSAPLMVASASTTVSINAPAVTYKDNAIVTVAVTSPAATPTGTVVLTVDAGMPLSATLSNGSATFTIPGSNAGDHSLNASYAAQGVFAASSATANLHVNMRPIVVTADAKWKTVGNPDPVLTYRITSGSLVNGESFTGSLLRDAGETVGTYAIRRGTLALTSNYILNYAGANLTIIPKLAVYASFSLVGATFAGNGGGLAVVNDEGGRPVSLPAGEVPGLTAASPDGSRLYVAFSASSGYSVHVIDTSDNHIVTTAKICSNTSTVSCAGGSGLSATNAGAYASFSTISGGLFINGGGLVFVNDGGGHPVSLPAGEIPELTAASPDGSRLYVGFSTSSSYSMHVIDTGDNHIVTTARICNNTSSISCEGGNGLSVTNTGAYASFSTNSGALVINGGGLTFVNDGGSRPVSLPGGEVPGFTAASPDGSRLYVGFSTSTSYSVHIIDTADNHIVTTAQVCSNTSSISCEGGNDLSATNTGAYASFSTNSGALVINGGGLAFVNNSGSRPVSLPAGEIPELTAASTDGSRLYVGFSAWSGYGVHVIDTSDNHIVTTAQICSNISCRAGNGLSAAITSALPGP